MIVSIHSFLTRLVQNYYFFDKVYLEILIIVLKSKVDIGLNIRDPP